MLGRRSFLLGCGCMTTVPAFARVGFLFDRDVHGSLPLDSPMHVHANANENLVFHIDGWGSPSDADGTPDTRATIRINSSWKAAWR